MSQLLCLRWDIGDDVRSGDPAEKCWYEDLSARVMMNNDDDEARPPCQKTSIAIRGKAEQGKTNGKNCNKNISKKEKSKFNPSFHK